MLEPSHIRVLNERLLDQSDESSSQSAKVLNSVELSQKLHKQLLRLKGRFLSDDGSKVDYKAFKESPDFEDFQNEVRKLVLVDLTKLNAKEQKAFFINVYNTLTVHALALFVDDDTSNVLQLEKFWQKNGYRIGDAVYSLDDIEHGVLRCNKLHPTYKDFFFKEGDSRKQFVQEELDPRIHFALNCGAKSCPPIRLFEADNLESALDMAARNFCQNDIIIDLEAKTVTTSKIFQWYGDDFGADKTAILTRITQFLTKEQANDLNKLLEKDFTLEFSEYDWKIF